MKSLRKSSNLMHAAIVALMFPAAALAQPGALTGVVFDQETKLGLAGAQVRVEGTDLHTVSGDDGRFTITRVPAGVYTVSARRLGFAPAAERDVIVEAGFPATVHLVLHINPVVLETVIASTGKVGQESLVVPASNALASLQGKMAGVRMGRIDGPGSDFSLYFRTPVSTRETRPLVIVDGVILASFGGSATDIPSDNIVSVEVLKGAAASAMYGARGAAGVVIIRTRRGR